MELDKKHIDETKELVLYELEKMFTALTHKFSSSDNHDKLNFLLDIESAIKQRLIEVEYKKSASGAST